jgi:hypothetical protein
MRPGLMGTAIRAIDITAVAETTDDQLAVTTRTLENPGTGVLRLTGPTRAGV